MRRRAVLFDLDETLIPEAEPLMTAYLAVARAVWGHDAAPEQASSLREATRTVWRRNAPCPGYRDSVQVGASDGLSAGFEGGGSELAAIRAFLPRFHAIAFDDALPAERRSSGTSLVDVWRRARFQTQSVYPGAHELLRRLRGGFHLGLVTNGPSDLQRRKLAVTRLAEHFDFVVASCDIGIGKPDPAIFHAALDALGVPASNAVMVGNDVTRDIEGAAGAGIRALWVQHDAPPTDGAVTELAQLPALLDG